MEYVAFIPFSLRLVLLFLLGTWLGTFVNWAIYRLAWNKRTISPIGPSPENIASRKRFDRIPVIGWFGLRRESKLHGSWFWVRPMLIELMVGITIAALYWWEISQQSFVQGQVQEWLLYSQRALRPGLELDNFSTAPSWLHAVFITHVVLFLWMLVATFIDIDERIIPDPVTATGILLGLILAVVFPLAALPAVSLNVAPKYSEVNRTIGFPEVTSHTVPIEYEVQGEKSSIGPLQFGLTPVWIATPHSLKSFETVCSGGLSLGLGLGCYWFGIFAFLPRIWRGRRGFFFTSAIIMRRVFRELSHPLITTIAVVGSLGIISVWLLGGDTWASLLSSLVGMVGGGLLIWGIRIVGGFAMQREAMGFGDVTLVMMLGTFLGWQACILLLFIGAILGLLITVPLLAFGGGEALPYGPYLCGGAAVTVVFWDEIWNYISRFFEIWWLAPAGILFLWISMGILLWLLQMVKRVLFGYKVAP